MVFLPFWLQNALCATKATKNCSRLSVFARFDFEMCFAPQRPTIFHLIWPDGSAPAALASLLFNPPEPQNIGKTRCFATFLPFAHFDLLSSSFLFSDSSHLCFFICPYCRKFTVTSKLPSIRLYLMIFTVMGQWRYSAIFVWYSGYRTVEINPFRNIEYAP